MQSYVGLHHIRRCVHCKQNHSIYNCNSFLKLTPRERTKAARQLQVCLNCLKPNHVAADCHESKCKRCNLKHNILLHWDECTSESVGGGDTKSDSDESSEDVKVSGATLTIRVNSEMLLDSAIVKVLDINQREHEAWV